MLVKNIDQRTGLVNGSRGVVISFATSETASDDKPDDNDVNNICPVVRFASGRVVVVEREDWTTEIGDKQVAKRTQIPLALAWCMTVHKAQGTITVSSASVCAALT
jgi:ATP-dependent DNA helicase PIF1